MGRQAAQGNAYRSHLLIAPNQLDMHFVISSQLSDSSIERRECPSPPNREREQVRVRHLTVPDDAREEARLVINQRSVVNPKAVIPQSPHLSQKPYRLSGSLGIGDRTPVRRHAHEAGFGGRASGPACVAGGGEPLHRPSVVHVIRPRECHEDVHVKKSSQRSSSADSTISGVIGGASSRTMNTGRSRS